jgi:hypothetical protein
VPEEALDERGEGHAMPLSDKEQNILDEIERQLQESDPQLAREVSETTVYRHALGSLRWLVVLFLVGLVVMIAGLTVHFVIGFFGFGIMLAAAFGFERNLRIMGRASLHSVTTAFRAANPNLRRPEANDAEE